MARTRGVVRAVGVQRGELENQSATLLLFRVNTEGKGARNFRIITSREPKLWENEGSGLTGVSEHSEWMVVRLILSLLAKLKSVGT